MFEDKTAQRILLQDQANMRRDALVMRVLDTLRQTADVRPLAVEHEAAQFHIDMTDASARVIAPLVEAVQILEAIIWASDGCMGHKDCVHSMEPWERARALLGPKWESEHDPRSHWPPSR